MPQTHLEVPATDSRAHSARTSTTIGTDDTANENTIPGARDQEMVRRHFREELSGVRQFFESSPDFFCLAGDFEFNFERNFPAKGGAQIGESRERKISEFERIVQALRSGNALLESSRYTTGADSLNPDDPILVARDTQDAYTELYKVVKAYKLAFGLASEDGSSNPTLAQVKDCTRNLLQKYFPDELTPVPNDRLDSDHGQGTSNAGSSKPKNKAKAKVTATVKKAGKKLGEGCDPS